MTLKTINKSLIEADTKYILHQCNCVTRYSAGIAQDIFDAFPWANTYSKRVEPSIKGTINIRGKGKDCRFVINTKIQDQPGKPICSDDYNFESYRQSCQRKRYRM